MAGAVGIVFGLCVLSFTLGAALMYVLVRRREDAHAPSPSPSDAPAERVWVEKPVVVEPVEDDYDSRPIHRNPVVGLPQLEPALAVLAEPVAEPEPEPVAEVEPEPEPVAEPETVGAAGYDRDGDLEPPVGDVEAPESTVAASTDSSDAVDEAEEPEPEPEPVPEAVVEATLPPPAAPQPVEHTTWVERDDFRQRYLRTFEEMRRKAGSN
ncbi:hypothetical protein [Lentzea flava]|uniref:Secreted protein n=1 Tax=Lentzea flava TaxID=103732 RepID=A0ABQ2V781_9PSEU|nr:hypothetical protein [Lentzea flava]MCP2203727.1 hypothetical protein [Lentzea flava]GGU71447.1 hypothetical protein GCM10010178_73920 [Lentzea flava]